MSPFEGEVGHSGGAGHAGGGRVVVVAVPGAQLVHYCTRVGFVQGVAIGRRKCH